MNHSATTFIEITGEDMSRPKERPPKNHWTKRLIYWFLRAIKNIFPKTAAKIVLHFFTLPGKVVIKERHLKLIEKAKQWTIDYKGDKITHYRWGTEGKKILLCHGWRSKIADFRRMIYQLLDAGYVVEGIDMRAHGLSEGKHTSMVEYLEIIKQQILSTEEKYHAVIGYSIGGMAAGMALSELEKNKHPKHFMMIASPSYTSYIFEDVLKDIGINTQKILQEMFRLMKEKHGTADISYYDLRDKKQLQTIQKHLIYCEDDTIVPFEKGKMLKDVWEDASFAHVKGAGHYKIIANEQIVTYLINQIGV